MTSSIAAVSNSKKNFRHKCDDSSFLVVTFFRGALWQELSRNLLYLCRSQSYQTLISQFFRFSLLSLSIWITRKYCLCFEMAKLSSKKWKKIFVLRRKKFGRIDSRTIICFKVKIQLCILLNIQLTRFKTVKNKKLRN